MSDIPHANLHVRARLGLVAAVALAAMVLVAILSLVTESVSLRQERAEKSRHLVEIAYGIVAHFHHLAETGALPEAQARREAMETLRHMRYGDQEYFWINDLYPRMVMHPTQPQLEGQDLNGYSDSRSQHLFVEMRDVVRRDGAGYVNYWWPKPGHDRPEPKISYVKGFSPWGWIIGSGEYVDDIDHAYWHLAAEQIAIIGLAVLLLGGLIFWVIRRVEAALTRYATALASSNAELRQAATVCENIQEAIVISDTEQRVVSVNPAFTRITGYGSAEFLGRNPSALRSERHDADFPELVTEILARHGHWQGEVRNRCKDGNEYPAWASVSVIRDESGRVSHYAEVFSDISAIKESEARLEQLAHHDSLTGLPNRLMLDDRAQQALSRASRHNRKMAVLSSTSTASRTSTTPLATPPATCCCNMWRSGLPPVFASRTRSVGSAVMSSPCCWKRWTAPAPSAWWLARYSARFRKRWSCSAMRCSSPAASASASTPTTASTPPPCSRTRTAPYIGPRNRGGTTISSIPRNSPPWLRPVWKWSTTCDGHWRRSNSTSSTNPRSISTPARSTESRPWCAGAIRAGA